MAEAFCLKVCQISQELLTTYSILFDLDVLCYSLLEPYLKNIMYISIK